MPRPPSLFEKFLNNLKDGLSDAADEFIQDVNQEVRRGMRNAARPVLPPKPAPRTRKRTQEAPRPPKPPPGTHPPSLLLYDVLEVSPRASQETISAAFRSLSIKYHPDKKTGNVECMKDISAAWSVLKDPVKRKRYDKEQGLV